MPSCSGSFACPLIFSSICSSISQKASDLQVGGPASKVWERFSCPKCPKESEGNIYSPLVEANNQDYIEGIRSSYTKDFTSKYPVKHQIADVAYLIDKLALRAGTEKDHAFACRGMGKCKGCGSVLSYISMRCMMMTKLIQLVAIL